MSRTFRKPLPTTAGFNPYFKVGMRQLTVQQYQVLGLLKNDLSIDGVGGAHNSSGKKFLKRLISKKQRRIEKMEVKRNISENELTKFDEEYINGELYKNELDRLYRKTDDRIHDICVCGGIEKPWCLCRDSGYNDDSYSYYED